MSSVRSPRDHSVNFETERKRSRGKRALPNQRMRIRDKGTHWQKERKACERKSRGWEKQCERGQIYQKISRSHIKEKKGTSETAGALGNNALLSFSFTSGPKRTWKPTTHADKTSHCCYCRLPTWRIRGLFICTKKTSSRSKKPETNKTGTHLKKSSNQWFCKAKQRMETESYIYIKKERVKLFFLENFHRGKKDRKKERSRQFNPGERTSQEINSR